MQEKEDIEGIWKFRSASEINNLDRFILLILVITGISSVLVLGNWWFKEEHVGNLIFYIFLSFAIWWGNLRLIIIWIGLLKIDKPEVAPIPPAGLKVAIFTTSSPGEPAEMFEKTLAACANIRYPHTTYLLDDTRDPRFRAIAERYGAVWLEILDVPGAKAGKINKALSMTQEEFILILDPDHIPFTEFLDLTLGFFQDKKIGFVQVCQAYYNQYRSFTAKGAAEQTYTFYGPSQMALHGMGCAVAIGANCTFRREALESIGGHGVGLAEDLITSIRIHAAGWKSVYNPVIVSRGLVPEDFGSFCKQQMKWSRGLFEVLFVEIPVLWKKLSYWQRLAYTAISSYYMVGLTMMILILVPFIYFITGSLPAQMRFVEFAIFISIVVVADVSIYLFIQKSLCHPKMEQGLHWRGMILKFACTPVFLVGFILSIVNGKIPYIPTAKKAITGYVSPYVIPLIALVVVYLITIVSILTYRSIYMTPDELILSAEKTWAMIGFSTVAFILSLGGIYAAVEARNLKEEEPWLNVPDSIVNFNKNSGDVSG
jgi:cellulose synthase (UDP-forming)